MPPWYTFRTTSRNGSFAAWWSPGMAYRMAGLPLKVAASWRNDQSRLASRAARGLVSRGVYTRRVTLPAQYMSARRGPELVSAMSVKVLTSDAGAPNVMQKPSRGAQNSADVGLAAALGVTAGAEGVAGAAVALALAGVVGAAAVGALGASEVQPDKTASGVAMPARAARPVSRFMVLLRSFDCWVRED